MMMCSETAPRLSFSHDVAAQADDLPIQLNESRRDKMLLEPCSDFEFNICSSSSSSFQQESCSADELFANGMIRPLRLHEKQHVRKWEIPALAPLPPPPQFSTAVEDSNKEEKPQSKSFWGFNRSSSLNYDIRKSLICPLPLLSRSNSTGSVPTPKRPSIKDVNKHSSQKPSSISMTKSSSTSSSSSSSASSYYSNCNAYQFPQRPPLKKNNGNYSYGNGVRISPVLNVPSANYISKGTANLFGLGSFLRNGKNKKSKSRK